MYLLWEHLSGQGTVVLTVHSTLAGLVKSLNTILLAHVR